MSKMPPTELNEYSDEKMYAVTDETSFGGGADEATASELMYGGVESIVLNHAFNPNYTTIPALPEPAFASTGLDQAGSAAYLQPASMYTYIRAIEDDVEIQYQYSSIGEAIPFVMQLANAPLLSLGDATARVAEHCRFDLKPHVKIAFDFAAACNLEVAVADEVTEGAAAQQESPEPQPELLAPAPAPESDDDDDDASSSSEGDDLLDGFEPTVQEKESIATKVRVFIKKMERDIDGIYDLVELLQLQDKVFATERVAMAARTHATAGDPTPTPPQRRLASDSARRSASRMSLQDIATINLYTQDTPLFRELNAALREMGIACITTNIIHHLPYANLLLRALIKLPLVGEDGKQSERGNAAGDGADITTRVYRGVKRAYTDLIGENAAVGDLIVWDAFTSTSQNPDVLRCGQFLGIEEELGPRTVFQLNVYNGVQIQEFSAASTVENQEQGWVDEEEVLILPGATFRIHAIQQCANGITEVQMHEVNAAQEASQWWLRPVPASNNAADAEAESRTGATQSDADVATATFDAPGIYLIPAAAAAAGKGEGDITSVRETGSTGGAIITSTEC